MSTFAYAALTRKRQEALPNTSTQKGAPGLKTYADAFAALVPAEVLLLHGAILSVVTKKTSDTTIEIVDVATLKWAFVALVLVSAGLYVAGRVPTRGGPGVQWDRLDWGRMWIPPLAFVGWTMLQKTTAFDALGVNVTEGARYSIAIIGGAVLGVIASKLAYEADQAPVKKPEPQGLPSAP